MKSENPTVVTTFLDVSEPDLAAAPLHNAGIECSIPQQGVLAEEIRDTNGDGTFDVSVRFGPFVNPIQTNRLALPKLAR